MATRLSYRGLKCPACGYSLEGLSSTICPECGEVFDPDWLYSADYEHAFQWTPRRNLIAWLACTLMAGALLIAAGRAGGEYLCMLFAVIGVGLIFLVRKLLL